MCTEYDTIPRIIRLPILSRIPKDFGAMTALIRYKTLYIIDESSLILTFVVGDDIFLRSVLSLPTFIAFGAIIDVKQRILYCTKIDKIFSLTLSPSSISFLHAKIGPHFAYFSSLFIKFAFIYLHYLLIYC